MTRPFGQIEGFVGLQQGPAGLPRRARPQISAAQPLSAGSHPRQAQSHLRAPAATTLKQLSPKQRESLLLHPWFTPGRPAEGDRCSEGPAQQRQRGRRL